MLLDPSPQMLVPQGEQPQVENPLIWPLLSLLKASDQHWKIHLLALELSQQGLLDELDTDPQKNLFKRNFLMMNALFEIQSMLLPTHWLHIQAMDIHLSTQVPNNPKLALAQDSNLRDYYSDWNHYDTCANVVREMLDSFWSKYQNFMGFNQAQLDKTEALAALELPPTASAREIRKQWRRLALQWHPDRQQGDAARFRQVCEAWQSLRDVIERN
ncbi:DNA-J related domain-containing protein [Shewanella sp. NIFS-20-20]|uniref:DNA-J related domain-containing protein n=1 Tax=Shewanella sp. NIFS-20-20 TaxID=2853806 RepID=UPI001C43B81E|nr:DNA-J related domain-containing protein [Shewanella sp. NIFS-20-20]MBV7315843.1 DnaJ domain-containing protein [Shewanella sp. NIFS-20-20]